MQKTRLFTDTDALFSFTDKLMRKGKSFQTNVGKVITVTYND